MFMICTLCQTLGHFRRAMPIRVEINPFASEKIKLASFWFLKWTRFAHALGYVKQSCKAENLYVSFQLTRMTLKNGNSTLVFRFKMYNFSFLAFIAFRSQNKKIWLVYFSAQNFWFLFFVEKLKLESRKNNN